MANMPDINKKFVSALLPLTTIAKLDREAKNRKMTRTQLLSFILDNELDKVELTYDDCLWIANQVKLNEKKRSGDNA